MSKMEFLDEIPIDVPSALQQLLGRFQSVRDGLPELVKNAKDQYMRLGVTERSERVIVVFANSESKRLGVLDFGGATKDDFKHWLKWADPTAANRGHAAQDVEGGHGNGGKGFMVRGSTGESFFESCRDGVRTKMGFSTTVKDRQYFPAYFTESGKRIDGAKVSDLSKQLELVLEGLGARLSVLPDAARSILQKRKTFSIVQINGVRDWTGRPSTIRQLAAALPDEIVEHAQAALAIETCSVFFVVDGKRISDSPLERMDPEPMTGFESLAPIPIPAQLPDPKTGDMVSTVSPKDLTTAKHELQLKTSVRSLRMGTNKALNVVRIRSARNVIGNWSVADLDSQASSAFLYGSLVVPSMGPEHQVGADRVDLADTPLVRALRAWTSDQIIDLANNIQRAISKEHKPEELDKATNGLEKMREAMREFLEDAFRGQGGRGINDGIVGPPTPEPGRTVRQIVLEDGAQSIALARGTSIPLSVRAYDVSPEGEKLLVLAPTLELASEPPRLVSLTNRRTLCADGVGRPYVWFCDRASGIESNRVEVEIIHATGAEIREVPSRLLLQGETVPLRVVFHTTRGTHGDTIVEERRDLLVDAEVDEPLMGRVDRFGTYRAGGQEGTATIRVRYGSAPGESTSVALQVGPDRLPKPPKKGGSQGPDVPVILLCGNEAPNMDQFPVGQQRTIPPSDMYPTIIDDDPIFEPTIFINPDSRESCQVRKGRGGSRGTAGIGSAIFLQFLAIKCFEILKRLYVRQSLNEGATTELEFRRMFAEAEMICAPFIDKAFEIAHELSASSKDQQ